MSLLRVYIAVSMTMVRRITLDVARESPLRRAFLLATVVLSLLAAIGACAAQPRNTEQRLMLEPCRLVGVDEEVRCGVWEVFEDRSAGHGRKIPLRVAVLPATGGDPAPDPVFFFEGGPGASAVEAAAELVVMLAEVRRRRELVLVDVRGTGASNPLFCPYQQDVLGSEEALETFIPADQLPACRTELEKTTDLTLYTTPEIVDDVDEVRRALGYDKVNLLGLSYGTRAVQVYLRRHPQAVRTAVLEGVVPLGTYSPETLARDTQAALDALFAECAAEPACAAAFLDPAADLGAVLERLEGALVSVPVVDADSGETHPFRLTRSVFVQTVRYMLYSADTALQVPLYLRRAVDGDFAPLAQMAYIFGGYLASTHPDGLYLSVTCAEDVPFIDWVAAARQAEGTFLGNFRLQQQRAACAPWPRGRLPEGFHLPVRSQVPALLISGERDPATPAAWGEAVARYLPASRHLVVPDGSHLNSGLEGTECIDRLMAELVEANSAEELDVAGCERSIHRPAFALEPRPT